MNTKWSPILFFYLFYLSFLGNGDLAKEAFGDSLTKNTESLERLYNVSNTLIQTKDQIQANKNSIAITTINTQLNDYKINFANTVDPSIGSDSLISQFLQINQWADYNANGSYQKGCSSNTRDFWSTNLDTCKSGYVKVTGGSTSNGDSNCLIFSEWTSSSTSARYTARPLGCSTTTGSPDFTTVLAAVNAYYNAFTTYSTANTALINQLQGRFDILNSGFTSMSGKLLVMLDNINGIIDPLVKIFKDFVGDAGILALINCSKFFKFFKFFIFLNLFIFILYLILKTYLFLFYFYLNFLFDLILSKILKLNFNLEYMGTDIRAMLEVLSGGLSSDSSGLSGALAAAGFLLYFGQIFMFIVILRKKIQPDDQALNEGTAKSALELAKQN